MRSTFVKNVLLMMSGTAMSQAIIIAGAPVLTRLYSPSDFGIYSLFVSVTAIIVPIAALRYDLAIVLPKDDDDAVCLLYTCILAVLMLTVLIAVFVLFLGSFLAHLLGVPSLEKWLWWTPVSIFAVGIYQILFYWSSRKKTFKRISFSTMVRSFCMMGTQIAGGVGRLGVFGLVIGQLAGQVVASLTLLAQVWKNDKKVIKNFPVWSRIRENIVKYSEYPLYSTPQTLLNLISQNIPAFFLAFFFGPAVVGFYMFAQNLLGLPISLFAESVRQVFYPRISDAFNEGNDILPLVTRAVGCLLMIGLGPAIILTILGPEIFSFFLGKTWERSGLYCQFMTPWLLMVLIKAPTLPLVNVFGLQRLNLFYEIISLILRLSVVIVAGKLSSDVGAIVGFAVVGFVVNFSFILYILNFTKNQTRTTLINLKPQ